MRVEQRTDLKLTGTRRGLFSIGALLTSGLAVSCNREYHLDDEVRNDPNDPISTAGRFFITLHSGLTNPEIGRYRFNIASGTLARNPVAHTFSIRTEPLLDLITVVLVPTGDVQNLRTVRLVAQLGVVQNSLPRDRKTYTLYNVDPLASHTLEVYWSNLKFTRLTWNGELLRKPEPTAADKSLA